MRGIVIPWGKDDIFQKKKNKKNYFLFSFKYFFIKKKKEKKNLNPKVVGQRPPIGVVG
jgi:hypothetical protein